MKKLVLAAVAVLALFACKGEREYLDFRGLSMGMSGKAMCDSLINRGFVLDSNLTEETTFVLKSVNEHENCRVDIVMRNDTITDILEMFEASYNDSTTAVYRARHKEYADLYGWANMKHDSDLHREAAFQVGDKGGLILKLLNTYSPTLTIHYSIDPLK